VATARALLIFRGAIPTAIGSIAHSDRPIAPAGRMEEARLSAGRRA